MEDLAPGDLSEVSRSAGRRRATSVVQKAKLRPARYYSSFPMASFSLFMAITGGDDWWNLVRRRPCQKVPGPFSHTPFSNHTLREHISRVVAPVLVS